MTYFITGIGYQESNWWLENCWSSSMPFVKNNQWCFTSSRDLIKDSPLRGRKRRGKNPPPDRNQTHDFNSFALQVCAQPLCYSRYLSYTHINQLKCNHTISLTQRLSRCTMSHSRILVVASPWWQTASPSCPPPRPLEISLSWGHGFESRQAFLFFLVSFLTSTSRASLNWRMSFRQVEAVI